MPEYILAGLISVVMGWGAFTWKKAETALEASQRAESKTDKLELKIAENYLTREEFEHQMERLFKTLERLEEKLDFTLYEKHKDLTQVRAQMETYRKG
jgi:hypothetical protein